MLEFNALYTQSLAQSLSLNNTPYGTSYLRYEVRQVTDVRNLNYVRAYRIVCTQRIVIPNATPYNLTPGASKTFSGYPALLSSNFEFVLAPDSTSPTLPPNLRLLDYAPRTMNTTVMTSANQSDGTNKSFSRQHTTGSSTSQTNTYGGSVSVGFFGEDPTGSASADYSHSTTIERSTSDTTGAETGSRRERGASDSMSIKDWGAYTYLDTGCTSPTWIWGQEYPWDVIQYRYCPTNNQVSLPAFVSDRLFDTSGAQPLVFPPSQLSLFGIDFTMKAVWQVDLPAELDEQTVEIEHALQYVTASHGLDNQNNPSVTLNPVPMGFNFTSPTLDLTLLGLDAIRDGSGRNGAVIGFIPSKFIVPPSQGAGFKILSEANNLQVTGAGFDAAMTTGFNAGPVTLTIQFKIIDDEVQYALFMKHWKTGDSGLKLTFVVNGDTANPIVRRVDSGEGEGGDDNMTAITLRNRDYTSIDYHDYLVKGLNKIEVTITPDQPSNSPGYQLRALAIGEG